MQGPPGDQGGEGLPGADGQSVCTIFLFYSIQFNSLLLNEGLEEIDRVINLKSDNYLQ